MLSSHGFSAKIFKNRLWMFHHVAQAMEQRYTDSDAKPHDAQPKLMARGSSPWELRFGAQKSAWRIPLNALSMQRSSSSGHVFILICSCRLGLHLYEIPKIRARTVGFLLFSGFAGSALAQFFITLALKYGNPTW